MSCKLAVLLIATSLAGGCGAMREHFAEIDARALQQQEAEREAYLGRLVASCSAMGFAPGTEALASCVLSLHRQNQANLGAAAAALIGAQAIQQQQRTYTAPRSPQTQTTNCNTYGGQTNCTTTRW